MPLTSRIMSLLGPSLTTLPSIVLVHGGWQSPSSFSLLVPLLSCAGYNVVIPTLASSNPQFSNPRVSFTVDVAVVRSAVENEILRGREVVVVMHSYGAIVGCEAMKGVKVKKLSTGEALMDDPGSQHGDGGVKRLIFISGMVLPVGQSCESAVGSPKHIPGWNIGVSHMLSQKQRHGSLVAPAWRIPYYD